MALYIEPSQRHTFDLEVAKMLSSTVSCHIGCGRFTKVDRGFYGGGLNEPPKDERGRARCLGSNWLEILPNKLCICSFGARPARI